jgi:hypothetical protein
VANNGEHDISPSLEFSICSSISVQSDMSAALSCQPESLIQVPETPSAFHLQARHRSLRIRSSDGVSQKRPTILRLDFFGTTDFGPSVGGDSFLPGVTKQAK